MTSFTLQPHYPLGNSPWYPLDRRLGWPQSRSGRRIEKKILAPTRTQTTTPRSSTFFPSTCPPPSTPWPSHLCLQGLNGLRHIPLLHRGCSSTFSLSFRKERTYALLDAWTNRTAPGITWLRTVAGKCRVISRHLAVYTAQTMRWRYHSTNEQGPSHLTHISSFGLVTDAVAHNCANRARWPVILDRLYALLDYFPYFEKK
jgi:hypothetical protein